MMKGFLKPPYAALRFPPRRCGVRKNTPQSGVARPARGLFKQPSAKRGICGQRGIALILVLLMISVIIAVTVQLNRSQRSEIYEAANLSDGIRLRYVARSAFYAGEAILLADRNGFDALTEDWAMTEMLSLRSEEFFDNATFRLLIEDEAGKIPINRLLGGNGYNSLIRDLLLRLLTGPYFNMAQRQAEDLCDAIKDWIDPDDEVTGNGTEGGYYASLPRPYAVKNASLDCIEELLMVKGVTRELFYGSEDKAGLVKCLTVFGDGMININTAPKEVLRALSPEMTDETVNRLDLYRRDAKNNLADASWYTRVPGAAGVTIPAGLASLRSDTFRITAIGQQGRMAEQITGIVRRETGGRKIKLLSWRLE
jgi:general secretion pathway protein K